MVAPSQPYDTGISLEAKQVISSPPWEVYLLPIGPLPVPEPTRGLVRAALQRLTLILMQHIPVTLDLFVELNHLHPDGGSALLSSKGREWMPKVGLGVWPDRPAPTFWTRDDFVNLKRGERPRKLMDQVLHITASVEMKHSARDSLAGRGAVVQVMLPSGVDFLKNARNLLLPAITDPSFTCFPFYVPLLEKKSIRKVDVGKLDSWLCGASVYIRESSEDEAIFVISKVPLKNELESMGIAVEDGSDAE